MPSGNITNGGAGLPSVLIVHNKYRRPGGEDTVVAAETDLLRASGTHVETMIYDSWDQTKIRGLQRNPRSLIFNPNTSAEARDIIRRQQIQIVHCHNLFPLLSTSIYATALAEGVPIVQTVHNYRMGCLNGLHLRNGHICQLCRPGRYIAGMAFGCYRGSRIESAAVGVSRTVNTWRGVWDQPTVYVTPTAFLREKLLSWGIPDGKIVIKPHFVRHDPGRRTGLGEYALYVGRISVEKGLDLLLDVWNAGRPPLVIAGDGPLREHLEGRVQREELSNVRFVGFQDRDAINTLMRDSRYLIMPSTWFETFGLVLIEAYAHGVPVIATRLGAMADVVREGETGFLFEVNDRADLAAKIDQMESDMGRLATMGAAARQQYEQVYSAESNLEQLRAVYTQAFELWRERDRAQQQT